MSSYVMGFSKEGACVGTIPFSRRKGRRQATRRLAKKYLQRIGATRFVIHKEW